MPFSNKLVLALMDHVISFHDMRSTVASSKGTEDGSAPAHFDHAEMITIIRVGREDIVGWDGNSTEAGKKRHCMLEDFEAQSNIPWRREHRLSELIGEIFKCDDSDEVFKAVYVFQRNKEDCEDECEIVFRDHHFNVRNIPRSRPKHRSLSMYLLDMERQHELELFEQLYNSTDADARERRNTHLEFIKDQDKGVNTQASDIAEPKTR